MYGIQIMVVGMGVVFASLIGLTYLMEFMHRLFGEEKKEGAADPDPAPTVAVQPDPVPDQDTDEIPAEVIAVIAGSIAAYLDTTAPSFLGAKIKVVRRQIPLPASLWSMAGRQEQMNLRQMG